MLGYMFPPLHSPLKGDFFPGGERAAAQETDLQLAVEATRIQPEQTPAFHLTSQKKSDPFRHLELLLETI